MKILGPMKEHNTNVDRQENIKKSKELVTMFLFFSLKSSFEPK